jgi:hypothetical protein
MSYPYIVQGSQVTVVIGSKPHVVSKSHPMFQKVVEAIKTNDWETVDSIIDPKKVVLEYGNGNIAVEGDKLFWKGEELHSSLSVRMIRMLQDGFDIKPMVAFMENLMLNPSKRAVTELYGFLEKNNLPITPDGSFLAYKRIRQDYKDVYSGTMDNSVGSVVEMERNRVDDDQNRTCSTGLHFCSQDYLRHYGGERIVIVKINPRDVVSIPNDYNDSKGRACRYEVVDEIDKEKADEAFAKSVQEASVREASVLTDAERVEVARLIQEVLSQRKAQAHAAVQTDDSAE